MNPSGSWGAMATCVDRRDTRATNGGSTRGQRGIASWRPGGALFVRGSMQGGADQKITGTKITGARDWPSGTLLAGFCVCT